MALQRGLRPRLTYSKLLARQFFLFARELCQVGRRSHALNELELPATLGIAL